eukprot:4436408-Prymnesium_polylepis.1
MVEQPCALVVRPQGEQRAGGVPRDRLDAERVLVRPVRLKVDAFGRVEERLVLQHRVDRADHAPVGRPLDVREVLRPAQRATAPSEVAGAHRDGACSSNAVVWAKPGSIRLRAGGGRTPRERARARLRSDFERADGRPAVTVEDVDRVAEVAPLGERHLAAVGGEVEALPGELGVAHIVDGAVEERPDGDAQAEVGRRQHVPWRASSVARVAVGGTARGRARA